MEYKNGKTTNIRTPAEFPENQELKNVTDFKEPIIKATIIFPVEYIGPIFELIRV